MDATALVGTGWRFPPQFSKNGRSVVMASESDEIRESLAILLSTLLGERLYHPDYGCDLQRFMFEEVNSALVTEIQEMVATAIYAHEPRVEILAIDVTEAENNAETLLINIHYLIIATNREENLVYSLPLY